MEATLVFPHQLFAGHPGVVPGRRVLLLEDPMFFGNDRRWPLPMHKQKLVLHMASMACHAEELEARGVEAVVVENPGGSGVDGPGWLDAAVPSEVRVVHACDPVDDVVRRRVERLCEGRGVALQLHESPNFLTPGDFLARHTGTGLKRPFMARFYQAQRSRMRVLLDEDGGPAGGKWSFDVDNRRKLPKGHVVPASPRAADHPAVETAMRKVERKFAKHPGDAAGFRWAVTRAGAREWLDEFVARRLADFGAYEDAISSDHGTLYHSALTPMLNIGLLDPGELVDAALRAAEADGSIPLNSLEGFVRQVIGWREFMAGIYRHRGVALRNGNFWGHDRPMPRAFYDATTGIPPVDRAIRRVLRDGWCHHIERLMVLGNFMLLCRIRPDDVYRWFMELFVDAYDWVMVPNVYGMSQFADGGTFTTKPYLSGSNYILKMSDERKGDWCAVWDGLFWSFIADHAGFFGKNPRLSMMVRSWERMPEAKRMAHTRAAAEFLEGLR